MTGAARDVVHRLMADHRVPGLSLAVTDAERLLFAEGFGQADLAARRPVTPETRFLWFSMSKIATATAAMALVDSGQLDLEAPVDSVVPGFRSRQGGRPVVRQLLNHTSGAGNPLPLRWILPADATPDDAREFIRHEYGPEEALLREEIDRLHASGLLEEAGLQLDVFVSPGGYILGEEWALIECMEGRPGEPRTSPPSPAWPASGASPP